MKTKLLTYLIIIMTVLSSLVSCTKEEEVVEPVIQLSSAELLILDIQSVMNSKGVNHIFCTEIGVFFTTNVISIKAHNRKLNQLAALS